jgi:hypothetical protein
VLDSSAVRVLARGLLRNRQVGRNAMAETRSWTPIDRMLDALPSYWADARESPQWLLMFALARFVPVRRLLRRIARLPAARDTRASALFPSVRSDAAVARLQFDGVWTGLMLPPRVVDEIRAFATRTPCYGNFDRKLAFLPGAHAEAEARHGRGIVVGQYLDAVEDCPAIRVIREDPLLWRIATDYLRTDPIVVTTRLWWSFPSRGGAARDYHMAGQGRFHFDLDDWRSLKFFFYLTDVDARSGPHVVARGTHRFHKAAHQFSPMVGKTEEAVRAAYGDDALATITGPAGFGFAEDPFAFHMGALPQRRPRLMAEIEFGVSAATRRRFYGDLVG